jgi:hypothetical protein
MHALRSWRSLILYPDRDWATPHGHYFLYARRRFTGSLGSPLTSSHQRFFAHCTAAGTHQRGFLSALFSVL